MGHYKHKPIGFSSEATLDQRELILYNDDVNTFDHVIESLVDVCEHTPEQAEQCAMLAHLKGKCSVLEGEFGKLKAARDEMVRRELSVKIE